MSLPDGGEPAFEDARRHVQRAFQLLAAKQHRQALAAANEALALAPHSKDALRARTLALLRAGTLRQALDAADDVLRASPAEAWSHHVKALVWMRHQHWGKAGLEFRHALELAPDHVPTLFAYAAMLLGRNDLSGAEALRDRCISLRPDDPSTLLLRGEIAWRSGRREEAKDCARWALSLDATNKVALALLARTSLPWHGLGRRALVVAILLNIFLAVAGPHLPIGANAREAVSLSLTIGTLALVMFWRGYIRWRFRRDTREVALRGDF